ncbi:glycosyltransferase family 4 protein [Salinibacterium sp. SYSU T00001]|uniref:glycosyltransferase family 4 protein n=1 Tax=Homoserinimonas sedimenticola TaxID=2986805 RepID=UPI00223673E7|nr:glycosyltransferase family 1 protein [Salinibacterium sedimenticola]MCW4384428.1 glycosyltransferase family 4 protein [Salinibacterium sedimenticola]
MKIVFDCRYTRLERHDGISRYTAELVTELAKLTPVTMLISDERQLAMLPELPWIKGTDPTSLREPWVSRIVNRAEPDIVFTPMQMMGSIGRRYRFVLTLHDLIYYRSPTPPREFSWAVRAGWRVYHWSYLPVRMLLRRADAIVTGSYTTREEIRAAGLTRRPITVVRSAVRQQPVEPRHAPEERNIVYMGSFMPYKNVETIARAMHELPGYRAHLLSRVSDADRRRLDALAPAGSLVFHDGVTDAAYRDMLANATALVSASRDEGFGIPLVEAMAVGTPVVVSDIPVFHEIGGDAAGFFAPDDPAALAARVRELEAPGEWERRSARAVELAAEFTWERSARTLYELALGLMEQPLRRGRVRGPRRRSAP